MRRGVVILGAVMLCLWAGGAQCAEPAVSKEEKQLVRIAQEAIRDEIYGVAETKLDRLLKQYPKSSLAEEARIGLAEARLRQGRAEGALDVLAPILSDQGRAPSDAARYWAAEACSTLNQFERAEPIYRALLAETPNSSFAARAQLGLGWLLLQTGRDTEGETLLRNAGWMSPGEESGQLASLVLVRWWIQSGRLDEAVRHLQALLDSKPVGKVRAEARLWLAEIALQRDQIEEALWRFTEITLGEDPAPEHVWMRAWMQRGVCLLKLKRWDEALQSFEPVILRGQDEVLRLLAVRRSIEAARGGGQVPQALARLRSLFRDDEESVVAAVCLLVIGEAQWEDGQMLPAQETWARIGERFPGTTWSGLALQRSAEAELRAGNTAKALELFERAGRENPNRVFAGESQFRLAEVFAELGRFDEARAVFLRIQDNPSALVLQEKALFNAALMAAKAGQGAEFETVFGRFTVRYPESSFREALMFEKGTLASRLGQGGKARETWRSLLKTFPKGALRAETIFALGESQFLDHEYPQAIETLKEFGEGLATHGLAALAGYYQVMARYYLKALDMPSVVTALRALQKQARPEDAARIAFATGQVYFDEADFPNAQLALAEVAKEYPTHPLAEEALYFSGLAALRRGAAADALDLFEQLIRTRPQSTRVYDARVAQGHALRLKGKNVEALAVYEAILAGNPPELPKTLAFIGKGDCLMDIAGNDAKKSGEALAAYEQVARSSARFDLRSEAGWKRGRALERINRSPEALEAFMDVVYSRSTQASNGLPPEYMWFSKSVSDAGRLLEAAQNWPGALSVYRLAESLGGPEAETWRDRRLRIQREHFIYE
jgi:TolA-binding protein